MHILRNSYNGNTYIALRLLTEQHTHLEAMCYVRGL